MSSRKIDSGSVSFLLLSYSNQFFFFFFPIALPSSDRRCHFRLRGQDLIIWPCSSSHLSPRKTYPRRRRFSRQSSPLFCVKPAMDQTEALPDDALASVELHALANATKRPI
jgi:hypothetical protein